MCTASVKNKIPYKIQNSISNITVNSADSDTSSIAFIIAAAIASKHNQHIDTLNIATYLQQLNPTRDSFYSLFEIKKAFEKFDIHIDAKKNASPFDILKLTNEILIGIDQQEHYFALVGSSQEFVYLIYGVLNHKALICSLKKSLFIQNFTTNKFLILR
ncbi:hypothetical protein EXE30_03525 [Acinetobacter halotolerans]|uniref:Peptidase C39 domain-containing protein n=1 Tax=Acinetobacter halotolerans TaxID=1752076 RepID=A0A4Q6XL84_9GAMM|nr:hypothetical protein [Acinetobacter halotolerans]RZF55890.1 hypothetical protein EXE30_03525 [Acinetobacter halotolerans]